MFAMNLRGVAELAAVLLALRERVRFCQTCGNVSEEQTCAICRDPRRDPAALCVVEESKDVVAIERTREFRGRYHVLGGAISPMEGSKTSSKTLMYKAVMLLTGRK